jgi:hypothetical protein
MIAKKGLDTYGSIAEAIPTHSTQDKLTAVVKRTLKTTASRYPRDRGGSAPGTGTVFAEADRRCRSHVRRDAKTVPVPGALRLRLGSATAGVVFSVRFTASLYLE